jgi:formylglycine-generating enzyme required for sulfatase activity
MSGNVCEWCRDWYGSDYYEKCRKKGVVNDPAGPSRGGVRVLRGGSWSNFPQSCRVSGRYGYHPANRNFDIGFRLVLVSLPVQ